METGDQIGAAPSSALRPGRWWYAKLFLSLLVLGFAMRGILLGEGGPLPLVGQAMALLGGTLNLWHYAILRRRARSLARPVALVTAGGLFRWVRHPMYLGDLMLAAGLGWLSWSPITWILILLYLVSIMGTAREEDRCLALVFGDEFRRWQDTTGLLLPPARRR